MTCRRTAPALSLLALALAAAAATPARAFIAAEARISDFGYSLVDLRPGDGQAAGITFEVGGPRRSGGSEVTSDIAYYDRRIDPDALGLRGRDEMLNGFAVFKPLSSSVALPGISTSGSMSGSLAGHSFSYGATGRFDLGGAGGANWLGSGFRSMANPAFGGEDGLNAFLLAPYTRVVWTGQASIRLKATDRLGPGALHSTFGYVEFDLRAEDFTPLAQFSHGATMEQPGPGQRSFERSFNLKLSNNSASSMLVYMNAGSVATTQLLTPAGASIAPVPEPGTWALMLCGLVVVGAAARRGRSGGDGATPGLGGAAPA